MAQYPFTAADLEALRQWDTPTICNALEVVAPHRRGHGFTVRPMVAVDPTLKPICGLARTGTQRAAFPSGRAKDTDKAMRVAWYEYVADAAMPTVVCLQDLDDTPGVGAFWGEVNSAVHQGLGAQGVVTNGSVRDLDMFAPGFQGIAGVVNPSHAHVHIVAIRQDVTIHGMQVQHDDVVHADRHGAVVIPHDVVTKIPAAVDLLTRKEKVILDMVKTKGFNVEMLKKALTQSEDIH
ncbi:MAG TPA: RraA family protein [Roseomonas sp.]|nr:RraA family protein [Roseomonas sp.]